MPKLQIGSIEFHYELIGNGKTPIVFLSGYTGDIDLWRPIAEVLAKKTYRALIFSNQGIGETKDDGSDLTCQLMAHNTQKLLTALQIERPVVVGFAMGTNISMELARIKIPSKLVLLNPVLRWSKDAICLVDELIALRENGNIDGYVTRLYELGFGVTFKAKVPLEEFKSLVIASLAKQSIEDQKRQAEALKEFNARTWITDIRTIPTVVFSSREDLFARPSDAQEVAWALNAELVTLDCGHAAIVEIPDTIIELCKKHCMSSTSIK